MRDQVVNTDIMSWRKIVSKYQEPDLGRSLFQIANTLIPYVVLWTLMSLSLRVSYWLTLFLAIPAAGFMVRAFIIFHDCGHGSFFKSQKANDLVGIITGIITFTPYYHWRRDHAKHHATAGDLDRRGVGDVKTVTVQEYLAMPWWKRLGYRLMRWPPLMLTIGALFVFLVAHRFWHLDAGKRERNSVIWTNLALVGIVVLMSLTVGFKAYVMVQLPILAVGFAAGVWLFYVQHNFEGVYWARHEEWDFVRTALEGSSYYKLPRLLKWFTGNIGFHHIHHLSPRIPNYRLQKCQEENQIFQAVKPITLISSLKSLGYRLWDEENRRLVGFDYLKGVKPAVPD